MSNLTVLERSRSKREVAFEQSVDGLVEVMHELVLLEEMTGRDGLPQRVCLAFYYALTDAIRLAREQK